MARLTQRDEFGNADIIGVDSGDLMLNLGSENFNKVTEALNRLAEYEEIGTVEKCREAVEKQKAKKPYIRPDKYTDLVQYYYCPICGKYFGQASVHNVILFDKPKYCTCGQAISWEEGEEKRMDNVTGIDRLKMSTISEQLKELKKYGDDIRFHPGIRKVFTEAADTIETLSSELQAKYEAAAENRDGWIPCCERVPDNDDCVLLSFSNLSMILIGVYEQDEKGGAFYLDDQDEPAVKQGLFVNAWMPLPEPYSDDE